MLCAFQDYLDSVASFCHDLENFNAFFFFYFPDIHQEAFLINSAHSAGGDLQLYPFVEFRDEKTFLLEVRLKPPVGLYVRVRYTVSGDRSFT